MKSHNYHPIWFQRNRPYAKFCKQAVTTHGFRGSAIDEIQGRIIREWNTALDMKKVDKEDVTLDLLREISLAFYFGAFASTGYNLFSFTDSLGEMLANTTASEIPIKLLKSPFPVYFIQFHKPFHWGKLEISGAYVIDHDEIPALQVCLVIKPLNEASHWLSSPSGYFYLPLPKTGEDTLGDLISKTIESEIVNKWKNATSSMPIMDERVKDIREQRAKRESMDLSSAKVAIKEAMEYVANCLCYLSTHQTLGGDEYPSDTPVALTSKLQTAQTDKQKQKIQSQLKSMGFFPVTYIRLSNHENEDPSANSFPEGTGKRMHWRRGHWRNQRRGKSLSETQIIWIKPTLVGEGATQDDIREYRLT
ncbi:hypothetical protein OCF84_21030 (plasmid) [Shewanella xiamenensis]|uniref:Uncharacterized protein n=1 Tax=Shewanella xiamenensis TaxID=332186 RepID=A0ABT6UF23_9GAMM|nr:hypothetical protein [Shewanella xiamenensis]MDI5832638.1 hypothetical protein [Shewanella xiamenensis]WHF58004.1 hypothetical protein OCF84_21030 [Shewanella xiamenensis]